MLLETKPQRLRKLAGHHCFDRSFALGCGPDVVNEFVWGIA